MFLQEVEQIHLNGADTGKIGMIETGENVQFGEKLLPGHANRSSDSRNLRRLLLPRGIDEFSANDLDQHGFDLFVRGILAEVDFPVRRLRYLIERR